MYRQSARGKSPIWCARAGSRSRCRSRIGSGKPSARWRRSNATIDCGNSDGLMRPARFAPPDDPADRIIIATAREVRHDSGDARQARSLNTRAPAMSARWCVDHEPRRRICSPGAGHGRVGGVRRRRADVGHAAARTQPRRASARDRAGADGAGARQSFVHARGPRSDPLGRRRHRRQKPEPGFRRPHARRRRPRAQRCSSGSSTSRAWKCVSPKRARPTAKTTAPSCFRRCRRRLPTCRRTALPAPS